MPSRLGPRSRIQSPLSTDLQATRLLSDLCCLVKAKCTELITAQLQNSQSTNVIQDHLGYYTGLELIVTSFRLLTPNPSTEVASTGRTDHSRTIQREIKIFPPKKGKNTPSPKPRPDGNTMARLGEYAKVSLLPAGSLTLPEYCFCADQHDKTIRNIVPSMSFLVQHPQGFKLVFDLGMRKNLGDYPDNIQPHLKTRQPITTEPDAADSLRKGGLEPTDINAVVLSHVHYDHVGTPGDFSNADFIVGYGARHLLQNRMRYHSAANFEKSLLPEGRTIELPIQKTEPQYSTPVTSSYCPTKGLDTLIRGVDHSWKPLGPFDNSIDLFGDGLIFIVDSPGHLTGHLNLLARVSQGQWIYLAGDACHHSRILNGNTEMASWMENDMLVCIHVDKDVAADTLRRIQNIREQGSDGAAVEVVLAHDGQWFSSHQESAWLQCYL